MSGSFIRSGLISGRIFLQMNAVKYASAGYVGPYIYFLHPQMFLVTVGDWSLLAVLDVLYCVAGALVAMYLLATALTGWARGRLRREARGALLACSLAIVFTLHPAAVVAGLAAIVFVRRYGGNALRLHVGADSGGKD